jgi:hypothetical protein
VWEIIDRARANERDSINLRSGFSSPYGPWTVPRCVATKGSSAKGRRRETHMRLAHVQRLTLQPVFEGIGILFFTVGAHGDAKRTAVAYRAGTQRQDRLPDQQRV